MLDKDMNKNSMKNKLKKSNEAYDVLQSWVKAVPNTIKELEKKGDKEQLIKYKKQVKLVLLKLEEIKYALENEI